MFFLSGNNIFFQDGIEGSITLPGFWPFVDENKLFTGFVGVGNKNGVPSSFYEFKSKYSYLNYKYIFNCQNGPYLIQNYNQIKSEFDGVMELDYADRTSDKTLFCNHSMMARSMPYKGFFWPPTTRKKYDFGILTWGFSDLTCKRWDRGALITQMLCKRGYKGLVVSQRDEVEALYSEELRSYSNTDSLTILKGNYSETAFHSLMSECKVVICPNQIDAFPKFIIEMLLANLPAVISSDLLIGRQVLSKLGEINVVILNFSNLNAEIEKIDNLIAQYAQSTARDAWLESYNFERLTELWATEFNNAFGTKFKKIFYMNHLNRI